AEWAEAQQLGAERLDPERNRRLVERHETGRIEGIEQEVVPARQHAAHASQVVGRNEAAFAEIPAAQQGGRDQDDGEAAARSGYDTRHNRRNGRYGQSGSPDKRGVGRTSADNTPAAAVLSPPM